ncbi:outer membrane lipoprotein carrier protein LolA [Komagataeibacter intermedius]|uniref:Cell envelope biogenesis protein LolA n=2 Tax=Komagataeibacter intermedius TaxID=66229 RepID=A0A0N0MGX6_9PROT|nr:outer membrane lipoprotein carrier protein LolA [Komagataeibacter intermedius]KPH88444.1 cell envelope biogenesis protein LolA [Komagataeibacter intermedius AF2]MCF3635561.1 outer membrane lipoprotein carrier protein LolA [Komagataeibacter intermedius]GBQ78902.1 outer-membrane lipoprotein carrier protein [Komagataeibacter intermedius NRIC 0521]
MKFHPTLAACGLACLLTAGSPLSIAHAQEQMAVGASDQDHALLERVERHLDAISLLKARFRQTAPDGKQSTGTAWIDRTNRRMRFQYDPPSPLLLVANHDQVVFNDSQLDQTTTMPMEKTPLGLLLRPHLQLSGDVTVTGLSHDGNVLEITLVRTDSPGDGSMTLIFHDSPLLLRGWIIQDAQQETTRVDLLDASTGGAMPPDSLFSTDLPEQH